tara:strand:+ start:1696 stop:2307 length:612 start_codon:yes stop_codon:yes gene_type:complete
MGYNKKGHHGHYSGNAHHSKHHMVNSWEEEDVKRGRKLEHEGHSGHAEALFDDAHDSYNWHPGMHTHAEHALSRHRSGHLDNATPGEISLSKEDLANKKSKRATGLGSIDFAKKAGTTSMPDKDYENLEVGTAPKIGELGAELIGTEALRTAAGKAGRLKSYERLSEQRYPEQGIGRGLIRAKENARKIKMMQNIDNKLKRQQ